MFTINVEKECGCFKKSDFQNNMQFDNKDDALMEAKLMESHMNQKFCQKHLFYTEDKDDQIIIHVEERPKEKNAGGCCGGGHCS
jgi:hypothetical protein